MSEYSAQYFGGSRRFFYTSSFENPYGTAIAFGAGTTRVLNPIDGSETVGPPFFEMQGNANSAQGQSRWTSKLYKGPEDLQGSPTFHLTPEAFGKMFASAMGADDKVAAAEYGVRHSLTLNADYTPRGFTMAEQTTGNTDTTNSWILAGAYAHAISIDVNAGNQYATIKPTIVASKYVSAAGDMSTYDSDTTYWPDVTGIAPTKCGLWLYPLTDYTDVFGTFAVYTVAGTPTQDLSSSNDYGVRATSFNITYNTNCNLGLAYRAGTSSAAGFVRGQPYSLTPSCTITGTFALDATTDEILTHYATFTDAVPLSWTAQFSFCSDDLSGTTNYSGGKLVVNAMRLVGLSRQDGGLGPATITATWEGMQAASSAAYIQAISWDDIDVDYA